MNDYPAPWSVLMRAPVIETRGEVPLNDFLSIATVVTVPGLKSPCPAKKTPRRRGRPACGPPPRGGAGAGVDLLAGLDRAAGQLGLASVGDLPTKAPATRYSREEIVVVNGATGS
jgi:hypothetical protein